jgi:hypothetical protein
MSRWLLRILLATSMWWIVAVAQTTPPLSWFPLEPKPVFLDCYRQAVWNGHTFIETGRTVCLGNQRQGR